MVSASQTQASIGRTRLSAQMQHPWTALLLVGGITFVIYYATLSFEFVWDDFPQIVDNPLLRSWQSVSRVFFSDLWFHVSRSQVYYRPLFVLWSILNFKMFGLNPWGWHLTTVLLHVAATCAVYPLARRLKLDHWTAVLAALLFGLHPIHIECAAWISAASESLVTLLYVLAFIGFLKSRDQDVPNKRLWQVVSCLLLACALLTKEMAITFALVVIAYDWLTTRHETANSFTRLWHSLLSATPYILVTLCYLVLRQLVLHRATRVDPNHTNFDVVLTWPLVLLSDLRLLIFPKGLTGLYYSVYAIPPGFWNFLFPLFVLCAFAVIIWYWARRRDDPVVTLSALWILIGLIPVLYLRALPAGGAVRDRYLYLPSVGFVLLLAKAIRIVRLKNNETQSIRLRWALVTVICAACIAGVLVQQVYWANNLLLFYRGYVLYPQNIDGAMELASALMKRNEYGRAVPILTALTHDHPQVGPPYYYLAEAYIHSGQKTEAQSALNTALELTPEVVQSNSGKSEVATLFAQLGDFESALKLYLDVLREEPDLYSANYNCGYMYFLLRQDAAAEKLLLHAVQVGPGFAPPVFYLGRIYLRAGKATVAESNFRRALALDANGYDFHYWLGQALAANDRINEARTEYAEELRLHPQNTNAAAALSMAAERSRVPGR